jgi:hypothetical protein
LLKTTLCKHRENWQPPYLESKMSELTSLLM